jgi:hypothetical protein
MTHAVEELDPDDLRAGCAGLRAFGLDEAAAAVERIDEDAYDAVVPEDSALVDRFFAVFEAHPERFAPLSI